MRAKTRQLTARLLAVLFACSLAAACAGCGDDAVVDADNGADVALLDGLEDTSPVVVISCAGVVCAPGEVCVAERCVTDCPVTLGRCGLECVNFDVDRRHCGACDAPCESGFVCDGTGQCALSCQAELDECDGLCVDLLTDHEHCGECGLSCGSGQICDGSGQCGLTCQEELSDCGGVCRSLATDRGNCGACGFACPEGFVCDGDGVCEVECQSGLTNCGGRCADTNVDIRHCGACDRRCGSGEVCVAGTCSLTCQNSLTNCGGRCVNVDNDELHCGACDSACEAGLLCLGGACSLECPSPLLLCDGACVDAASSEDHCGVCGGTCAAGEFCVDGVCEQVCPAWLDVCDGRCVDTDQDAMHCGTCGVVCAAPEVCHAGQCQEPLFVDVPCLNALGLVPVAEPVCDSGDPDLGNCFTFDADTEDVPGQWTVVDDSGYGGDGVGRGISYGPGVQGQSLVLDGTGQVDVDWHAGLTFSGTVTTEVWVYVDAFPSTGRGGIADGTIAGASMFLYPDGWVRCWIDSRILYIPPIPLSEWVHLACVGDGVEQRVYMNGTQVGSGPSAPLIRDVSTDFFVIGGNHPTGDNLVGKVDSLRIWRRARTEQEICLAAAAR